MAHLCLQKYDLESALIAYDSAVALLRMKQVREPIYRYICAHIDRFYVYAKVQPEGLRFI